jgi:hypothetical protein
MSDLITPGMQEILTLANTGGVIAVLVVILRYFVTGKVVPRTVVRSIVVETVDRMLSELGKRGFHVGKDHDP